jgi:uncharacterized protein (DUF58 family)
MGALVLFFVVLLAVAFFTRLDLFFYLFYALAGIYLLGRGWAKRSLAAVVLARKHEQRVFLGETFPVEVEIYNSSLLPVLWMRLYDSVPANLGAGSAFRHILSLLPHERLKLAYNLTGKRRGYYPIGPMVTQGGDLLGTATYEHRYLHDDFVIVYPKIVTLRNLGFSSHSPFGTLPGRERLFEDPSRILGVRDYQSGDSLRKMDWKTSARLNSLQIRRYEPAIALETAVFLNLAAVDYVLERRREATELGIVVAASLAVHLGKQRQAVGLVSNGRDPLAESAGTVPSLPLRKGREHVMNVLDLLARIEVASEEDHPIPFLELVSRKSLRLPWGSTAVLVTAKEVDGLMRALLALRRRGLLVLLVLTCPHREFESTAQRAEQIGVQTVRVWTEKDLDVWR